MCGEQAKQARRSRAALELARAQELSRSDGPASEIEALITSADQPGVLWQAAVELGDIHFRKRQFAKATQAYDRALEIIKNERSTPKPPPKPDLEALIEKANQTRMLAANDENTAQRPVFVSSRTAEGVGGGLSGDIRGVTPKAVPIPINFETGSAKFTEVGERAAVELVSALKEQRPGRIQLVGHTDERGADEYNLRLSELRVQAVAEFLANNGIDRRAISVEGKGKREPLRLTNTEGLTREDIWALNRRVEWVRH